MLEKNQCYAFQTIFRYFLVKIVLLKNDKNRLLWFKLSQIYGSTISFAYFEVFFLIIPMVKNFFPRPGRGLLPPCGGSIAPIYTEIRYDLTIVIINNYFEFQNAWLKIGATTRNFVLYH